MLGRQGGKVANISVTEQLTALLLLPLGRGRAKGSALLHINIRADPGRIIAVAKLILPFKVIAANGDHSRIQ